MLKIKKLENKQPVYDITVQDNENFYANGILVHNCLEITLPTNPLKHIYDEEGLISLCTLGGINLGQINDLSELEKICETLVRGIDNVLDYQRYPIKAAEIATKDYRPLGIGVINYAYYLAKNGLKYSDPKALELTHKTFEAIQYYCLKASNKLAKEKGRFLKWENSRYSIGQLPIDWYKKTVDSICKTPLQLDWETLRKDIQEHGLRNATLTAQFPSESSSKVSAATNGIEPVRGFVINKGSKKGSPAHVAPDFINLKNNYTIAWDIDSKDMIKLVAVMQKFLDQSISTNIYTNREHYPDGKIPMKVLKEYIRDSVKYGLKTLYYHNDYIPSVDNDPDLEEISPAGEECEGGACAL